MTETQDRAETDPPEQSSPVAPRPWFINQSVIITTLGIAILGGTIYMLASGSAAGCNSPELLNQFQKRFEASRLDLFQNWRDNGMPLDTILPLKLNVISTTTISKEGGWSTCEMKYNLSVPGKDETFEYLVGKNDQGTLIWRFNGRAPYDLSFAKQ